MTKLSYPEIHNILNQADLDSLAQLNISVLRTIMIESIEPYVRYHAFTMDQNAVVKFGEFDNVFQEAVGGNFELLNKDTDVIFVFIDLTSLSWRVARNFSALTFEEKEEELDRIKVYFETVLGGIRKQTNAMIVWHGLETPVYPALGVYDSQTDNGQLFFVRALNEHLRKILSQNVNSFILDVDICRAFVGYDDFYDLRYWHIGRAPYSLEGLAAIANEQAKFIRPLLGKNKKCLVLDCDNTIWGGIIGEVGLKGIKLSRTHPGSSFFEFQQEVVNLYNRGVIIALCSKNNEEDVWDVFENHHDMVLKREHIATYQINWRDKATNLSQIARDLNIGIDSLVFMDDSDFEVNLIKSELPEVAVVQVPYKNPVVYRDILARGTWFDTLTLSDEDKKRGKMYHAEEKRKKLKVQATDLKSYLGSLQMEIEIAFGDDFSIPRIAQQTQKTNQFNLTTRRYSEAEIKEFSDDSASDVLYLRLKDKYGDSGIVGSCILRFEDNFAVIDSFLLSCRVLGREVENVFLTQVLSVAMDRGCDEVIGEYFSTAKNSQVADFYKKYGFRESSHGTAENGTRYTLQLDGPLRPFSDFFKVIQFYAKVKI